MKSLSQRPAQFLGAAFGLAALGAVAGLAFALWLRHGAGIFRTMAETGLSWCL